MSNLRGSQVENTPKGSLSKEIKAICAAWCRSLEAKQAGEDPKKLQEIDEQSTDEILRKWLWMIVIVGAPACYIVLPLLLGIVGIVFSSLIMQLLWFLVKLAMSMMLIIFFLAVYFTWGKSNE